MSEDMNAARDLRDRRLQAWHEARALLNRSSEEKRALTGEEEAKWTALNDEIDKIDARLKAVLDAEERAKATEAAFDRLSQSAVQRPGPGGAARDYLTEVRNWAMAREGAKGYIDIHRQSASPLNLRVLTTGGQGSGTNASSTVPTDFYDQLIAFLIEVSGILQVGPSVLNTAGGETIQIPVAATHIAGATASQNATLPTSDPAFTQKTLGAQKFAAMTQLSRELIDDTAIDLLGYLAMSAGRAIGNSFGSALINGNNGISGGVLGASTAVTGATGVSGVPSYDNLVDLEYSVIAPYRQSRSCYWLAADKTIGGFRKIKDSQNRPIWEPSAVLGAPDLLLGKPLVADPFMPATATSAKSVAFGDFSQYFVRLVGGLRFERSDDFAFGSDLVTFRAVLRGDGNFGDTNAVKLFVAPST